MKEYVNKSIDELRMEDYQSNRKFLFVSSITSSTNFSSAFGKNSSSNLQFSFVQTNFQHKYIFLSV